MSNERYYAVVKPRFPSVRAERQATSAVERLEELGAKDDCIFVASPPSLSAVRRLRARAVVGEKRGQVHWVERNWQEIAAYVFVPVDVEGESRAGVDERQVRFAKLLLAMRQPGVGYRDMLRCYVGGKIAFVDDVVRSFTRGDLLAVSGQEANADIGLTQDEREA
jgi:hypothetical protein